MKDIPSLNREKAETEIGKFLLDSEAVNMMIQFYKMKADDPDFEVPDTNQDEGFFSLRTLVIVYLGYVAYSTFPVLIRRWIDSQTDWQGTGIDFVDNWIATIPPVATSTAQSVVDTVSSVADSIN